MATWQYVVYLVPRAKLVELFSKIPDSLDPETFNSTEFWDQQSILQDLESHISSFIKRCPSWSENIKAWGDEEGDFVTLLFESDRMVEVEVRIDVRAVHRRFVENVCRFARLCDCLLLTEELTVIEPDVDLVLRQIGQSRAFAFVSDPVGFLERLGTGFHES